MVTYKALISVLSFGLMLLSASAIGMSLPGTYLMTKLYACILSNNFATLVEHHLDALGVCTQEVVMQPHAAKNYCYHFTFYISIPTWVQLALSF